MRHSRYKYFSNPVCARAFQRGEMYCQAAAYFRDYEDVDAKQVVGDEYEGTRIYRPLNGLEINNLTQGTKGILNAGMECLTKAAEIYVFCVSLSFNVILKWEFRAKACVEIYDPGEFHKRWIASLPAEAKPEHQHVSRKVGYYNPEDVPGNVWALPDLITTTKLKRFEYQNEYRFAYTRTNAFGFQNCTYTLVDRKTRPLPRPEEQLPRDANTRRPSRYLSYPRVRLKFPSRTVHPVTLLRTVSMAEPTEQNATHEGIARGEQKRQPWVAIAVPHGSMTCGF